jgi:hypothetical protein
MKFEIRNQKFEGFDARGARGVRIFRIGFRLTCFEFRASNFEFSPTPP